MRRYSVRNKERGFTLTEMLVTVIVTGVLAAITAPSLVGLINRNQVKEAQRQVESALQEAQRQAMRRGKSCSIEIDPTNRKIKNPSGGDGCLLSERKLSDQVLMTADDGKSNTISFTHKGTTETAKTPKTIVVYSSISNEKKCIVIADILGTIKTGDYTGNINTPPLSITSCLAAD